MFHFQSLQKLEGCSFSFTKWALNVKEMLRVIDSVLTGIVKNESKSDWKEQNLCLNKKTSFTDATSTTEAFGDLHYVFCSCVVQTFKWTPTHKGHLRVEPVFSQHHFVLQTFIFFHQGLKWRISLPGRVHFLNTFLSAAQEVVRSTPPVHLE